MKVFIEKEQEKKEFNGFNGSVLDLLAELKINPETVLVIKNNELVFGLEELSDSDDIKVLSVVSGG